MYTTHFDAVNKIWSGPPAPAEVDKHRNFGEIILENLAGADSERVVQIDGDTGEGLTKAELRTRTIRCAQNLQKFGCTQDDCIGIIARNHHNLTPLLYAALCIGAPISPLDVVILRDEVSTILQRVRPAFIFCDADVLKSTKEIIDGIGLDAKLFIVNGTADGYDSIDTLLRETGNENAFVCTEIEDTSTHIAVIACSSGSTGLPKSICMTHALFLNTFFHRNAELAFTYLCFSSLYWFSGVWASVSIAFKNARVFTTKSFSPELFFDLVERFKVQLFIGPPSQLQAILKSERCEKADLSSLVMCFPIGGFIPSVLVQSMKQLMPKCLLLTTYGMTETGGSVSCTMPKELDEHPNSTGRLTSGVTVKLIHEKTGEKCGIDEEGEIHVKMPVMSMGYYKDEVATRDAFDDDGYFITGDLGFFDESGRLFVVGRKKEIFKNCGFAIWPAELENLIIKHSAVQSATVVSVYDDEIMSDLPAAVVIKNSGSSITEDEVYAIIADQLATYKRLDGGVYFVDELQMTPSGKIIRAKVKAMAQKLYDARKKVSTK